MSKNVLSKSTWGEQPVEDILIFTCICGYVFICLCHASWPNEIRYRPEIWFTRSPRPHLKTCCLFFSEKVTLRFASQEKMPCHVDVLHISSIALYSFFKKMTMRAASLQVTFIIAYLLDRLVYFYCMYIFHFKQLAMKIILPLFNPKCRIVVGKVDSLFHQRELPLYASSLGIPVVLFSGIKSQPYQQ